MFPHPANQVHEVWCVSTGGILDFFFAVQEPMNFRKFSCMYSMLQITLIFQHHFQGILVELLLEELGSI